LSKRGVKPINFYLLSINWIKATRTDRAASAIAMAARWFYRRTIPLLLDDVVDEDAGGLDVLGSYAAGGTARTPSSCPGPDTPAERRR